MHKLSCITNNKQYDITPIAGDIGWGGSTAELGRRLEVQLANSINQYLPKNPVDIGSILVLANSLQELYRGVAIDETIESYDINYISYDYAFYLNKSESVYQFKGIAASDAIIRILNDFKFPITKIIPIPVKITKIYAGDKVSDIIRDILKTASLSNGIKYRMEVQRGGMLIEKQSELTVKATFQLAMNLSLSDVTNLISSPSRKRSIADMRNSIKIFSEEDKSVRVEATAKDQKLIDSYGLLQEVQRIDRKDVAQAKNIAARRLKEVGKIFETCPIQLLGDDAVVSGRILEIMEPITRISGKYLITNDWHTLNNGNHLMQLELEVVS